MDTSYIRSVTEARKAKNDACGIGITIYEAVQVKNGIWYWRTKNFDPNLLIQKSSAPLSMISSLNPGKFR